MRIVIEDFNADGRLVASHVCEGSYYEDDLLCDRSEQMALLIAEAVHSHCCWEQEGSEVLFALLRHMPMDGLGKRTSDLLQAIGEAAARWSAKRDLGECLTLSIDEAKLTEPLSTDHP